MGLLSAWNCWCGVVSSFGTVEDPGSTQNLGGRAQPFAHIAETHGLHAKLAELEGKQAESKAQPWHVPC